MRANSLKTWIVPAVAFGMGALAHATMRELPAHGADPVAASTAPGAAPVGSSDSPFAVTRKLGEALVLVEKEYVEPVPRQKLLDGALKGMVQNLDPHSAYMDVEEYRAFRADTAGRFAGVGIEVDVRGDVITVIAPIEGSPAERAGVRSGDRIVMVDTENAQEVGFDQVVKRLRGPVGTKVKLVVRRPSVAEPITFTLVRESIHVSSIATKRLDGNVLYLRIKQFQERTHGELLTAYAKVRGSTAPEGIILDLRSNPGGLVDEALGVADEFLDSGVVYTMRARERILEEGKAGPGGALTKPKVVVLVNEWTASASELLTAALQDQGRAKVVGTVSFGKGSVQTITDLPDGSGIKLTIARYYAPSGRAIQAVGIKPDVLLQPSKEGFPMQREKDLEGHLPDSKDRNSSLDAGAILIDATAGEVAVPREVPEDPRKGKDEYLRVGYETLLQLMKR